jgi:hypothetical protein
MSTFVLREKRTTRAQTWPFRSYNEQLLKFINGLTSPQRVLMGEGFG